MALQKKVYRSSTNRSRGNGSQPPVSARSPKDYSKNIRAHHGGDTDEVMAKLFKQIARRRVCG